MKLKTFNKNVLLLEQVKHCLRQGQLQKAELLLLKLLRLNPDNAEAYNLLGLQLTLKGDLKSASQLISKAIVNDPNKAEYYNNLGAIQLRQGKFHEALDSSQKALVLSPKDANLHSSKGFVLYKAGRLEEAEVCFREALCFETDSAIAHFNLGMVLWKLHRNEEAIAAYRQAVNIDSLYVEGWKELSEALQSFGQLEEAFDCMNKAFKLAPENTDIFRRLSRLKKYTQVGEEVKKMEILYQASQLSMVQKMHLGFALGKVYEDIGDYEKSFNYLYEANKIKRSQYQYDVAPKAEYLKQIRDVFSKELLSQIGRVGCQDKTPIFIIGMPRSGTTLVEQILASHPGVWGGGESRNLTSTIVNMAEKVTGKTDLNLDTLGFEGYLKMGEAYIECIRQQNEKTKFITDKLPDNFYHLGMIKLFLPNARIIHCQRSPQDTCFSIFKNYFSDSQSYLYDLDEICSSYKEYEAMMKYWKKVLPNGSIYDIYYEKLIGNQQQETRKLLDHCGLEWHEPCLYFYNSDRAVKTVSATQVSRPIYKDSIGKWKHYKKWLKSSASQWANLA